MVKVTGAPWCSACGKVKALLGELCVPFEYVDCSGLEACPPEIPVVDIDGEVIVGYSESRIRAAVEGRLGGSLCPREQIAPSPPPEPFPTHSEPALPQGASVNRPLNPWPWMAVCAIIGYAAADYYIGKRQ
jgi:hypothetical protein